MSKINQRFSYEERNLKEEQEIQSRLIRRSELNYISRANYWTGLCYQPKNEERNWTTYICLLKRFKFPKELMVHINEYLNWLPAGCWYKLNGCEECGVPCKYELRFCSWHCMEIYNRNEIMQDYENMRIILFNEWIKNECSNNYDGDYNIYYRFKKILIEDHIYLGLKEYRNDYTHSKIQENKNKSKDNVYGRYKC